jgi:ferric-dicitrate binding protein FerR (iron transport regulator)
MQQATAAWLERQACTLLPQIWKRKARLPRSRALAAALEVRPLQQRQERRQGWGTLAGMAAAAVVAAAAASASRAAAA